MDYSLPNIMIRNVFIKFDFVKEDYENILKCLVVYLSFKLQVNFYIYYFLAVI